MKTCLCITLFLFIFSLHPFATAIILDQKSAIVWSPSQTISGTIEGFSISEITVHINDSIFKVSVSQNKFSLFVLLKSIKTFVFAETNDGNKTIYSDTLIFELGFKPLPVVKPFATNKKNIITLRSQVLYNPYNSELSYQWLNDARNPLPVKIYHSDIKTATVKLPQKKGIYYFKLLVKNKSHSVEYETYVIRADSIHCFDIENDHAEWIDTAAVYEIAPRRFVKNATYDDITQKLPELKKLGITAVWLQPIFKTHRGGQGYDVTDYFSLAPDLGDEAQLHQLISVAKRLQIKIIFDVVPNHTSVFHPYALDCMQYGKKSHYYDFYQHSNDGAQYSSLYQMDSLGFVHYFWKDLINLNYQNEEVQRWMIEACKYWLKKFDIDGYRFDAMWAVNARKPDFARRLQLELKSIKPDILLLAEDKGADSKVYKIGFDAAYDWELDTAWISHWSWQYSYSPKNDLTIFNHPDISKRSSLLRKALFDNGDSTHLRLRFIENNDLPRFIETHGLERTKMAAAMEFTLPGIPLMYNGQETGSHFHPYSANPVFTTDKSIKSLDKDSLFEYYQHLIKLRNRYKALHNSNIRAISTVSEEGVVAYHRWSGDEHFIVIINMSDQTHLLKFSLDDVVPVSRNGYAFIDMITNETFPIQSNIASLIITKFRTRILMIRQH